MVENDLFAAGGELRNFVLHLIQYTISLDSSDVSEDLGGSICGHSLLFVLFSNGKEEQHHALVQKGRRG